MGKRFNKYRCILEVYSKSKKLERHSKEATNQNLMEVESVCNINPFLEVLTCPIVQENWSCLVVFNDTIMSNTSNNLRTAIDELLDVVGVDSFDEVKQCGHTLNLNVTDGAATLVTVPVQDQGLSSMFYIVLVAGVVYIVHLVFTGYMNREKEDDSLRGR